MITKYNNLNIISENSLELEQYLTETLPSYSNSFLTSVWSGAFYHQYQLSYISLPAVTAIGYQAFVGCSMLQEAIFPNCTSMSATAFMACISLSNISFPKLPLVPMSAFARCSNLSGIIILPKVAIMSTSAFQSCPLIHTISIGTSTSAVMASQFQFGTSVFYGCSSLQSLYLYVTKVPTIGNSFVFAGCPLAGTGTGKIYVPASLYSTFLSSRYFRYYASHLVSM